MGEIEVSKQHPIAAVNERFGISNRLQALMCLTGQSYVFTEGEKLFEQMMGIAVNARQIQRVSEHYGKKAGETETIKSNSGEPMYAIKQSRDEPVYVMVDGSMVFTREEGWKEMKLGRIFATKDQVAQSESRTSIVASQYICHLGNHEAFTGKMEAYTDHYRHKIFIADGARWIWKWVTETYPEATQILDLFHAVEKLGSFAQYQFDDKKKRKQWILKQKEKLLDNKVRQVIKLIAKMKSKNSIAEKSRQDVIRYYQANQSRMQYETYVRQGYLVGSGAIESAHRNIIQQRMKLSGQRWSKNGVQYIANLRTCSKSNNWDYAIDLIKNAA